MSSAASMNSTKLDPVQEYKECAGKGCRNLGVQYLKVAFLNQCGWFCEGCKNSLIQDRLVEEHQTTDTGNRTDSAKEDQLRECY
jgi:hypothetical protein